MIAAAALPVEQLEEEVESHLGDFLGDCEGITLFSVPRPPCEIEQLPRELFIFLGKDTLGGEA